MLVKSHPRRVLAVAAVLVVLSLLATWRWLGFELDRTAMLGADHPVQRRWHDYQREFGNSPDFMVLVEGDPAQCRDAVDWLARQLQAEPQLFERVMGRLDLQPLARKALYYLPLKDLRLLHAELEHGAPWLEVLAYRDGLDRLARRALTSDDVVPQLRLLTDLTRQLIDTLESRGENRYTSPFPHAPSSYYTTLPGGRTYVLLVGAVVVPGSHAGEVRALERLKQLVGHVRLSFPDLDARISGDTAIYVEDMQTAVADAVQSGVLAVILMTVLLAMALGNVGRPLKLMAALLVGLTWSFGFTAVAIGQLNLLTIMFATILIGLGMTFGIDLLFAAHDGKARRSELIGVLSTAVAFYSLCFTRFQAAADLGLIVGTGVILIYLSMITVLPALVALERRPRETVRFQALHHLDRGLRSRPGLVLAAAALFTLYSATWYVSVPFDYNIMNLQPPDSQVVQVERFLQQQGYSSLFAVSVAPDVETAARRAAVLRSLPTVSRVETISDLLPSQTSAKRPLVERVVHLAQRLKVPATMADDLVKLAQDFAIMRTRVEPLLRNLPEARQLRIALVQLSGLVDELGPGPLSSGVETFIRRLKKDLSRQILFLRTQEVAPPTAAELPAALRQRALAPTGRVALRVFPRQDVWGFEPLQQFVGQLQRVDPEVTGVPVLMRTYLLELRHAYQEAARNAFIVICLLLLLHFRSFRRAGLAMLPKLLGIVWLMSVMGLVGEDFNVANFLALPLTLGIGLIFGVQVIQSEELFGGATGPTILLSGSTIIIGFGTLLLAQHRAIASLGMVLLAGIGTTLLATLIVLPALSYKSWLLNPRQLSIR